jgi:hypothetical protein
MLKEGGADLGGVSEDGVAGLTSQLQFLMDEKREDGGDDGGEDGGGARRERRGSESQMSTQQIRFVHMPAAAPPPAADAAPAPTHAGMFAGLTLEDIEKILQSSFAKEQGVDPSDINDIVGISIAAGGGLTPESVAAALALKPGQRRTKMMQLQLEDATRRMTDAEARERETQARLGMPPATTTLSPPRPSPTAPFLLPAGPAGHSGCRAL